MYLVTIEDAHGMWFDDPHGFDSLQEAQKLFNNLKVKGAASYVIYRCDQIEFRETNSLLDDRTAIDQQSVVR